MATLTMTPLDAPRPSKRFRRSTTSDSFVSKTSHTSDTPRARSSRSASTSSYPYSSRRSSITSGSHSLSHSTCASSFSHASPSSSRLRSAAEARALVLDPAYSGMGQTQARVFVDERGVEHDPDYRMFPAVPSSPPRSSVARRGSVTSARGSARYPVGSMSSEPGSPFTGSTFAGSPFAGYADFTHYSNSAGHEEVSDEEMEARMDIDEDAESEIEWSRLHASPPGYGSQEGGQSNEEDGYADFAGMEWDEKEWRREEVVPALDKHVPPTPTTTKGKPAATPALVPAPVVAPASAKSYPKPKTKARSKPKARTESVSSATARGYVPAKRSYDESVQDEWTPSCGYSVRRHWQSFTLRIRFSVFRWRRRLRRVLGAATSSAPTAVAETRT